jgi:hypothetical protein
MWMMVITGTILAAGFIFALRSQINTYKLGQAEEELRARLDEYAAHQKYLMVDQQRALSATESERASKEAGLSQLKLSQPDEMRNSAPRPISAAEEASAPQKVSPGQKVPAPQKALSTQKVALTQKVSAAQKASSPGRLIQASQRPQPASQAAKAKRDANNQRQIARSQQRR